MKSAVIVFPGSNCDRDMAVALELVTGRAPVMIWHRETELPPFPADFHTETICVQGQWQRNRLLCALWCGQQVAAYPSWAFVTAFRS